MSLNRMAYNLKYTKIYIMYLEAQKSLYINNTKKYLDIESKRGKKGIVFNSGHIWQFCIETL